MKFDLPRTTIVILASLALEGCAKAESPAEDGRASTSPGTPALALNPSAYPADTTRMVEPAPVDFTDNPAAYRYRTALRNGAAGGPNFASHVTVVSWGCGTGCQVNAFIDTETGKVHSQVAVTARGAAFRRDSRLFIADPHDPEEVIPPDCASCGTTAHYEWAEDRLVPIGPGPHPHLSFLE